MACVPHVRVSVPGHLGRKSQGGWKRWRTPLPPSRLRGRIYDDITQTIGNTPLIRLRQGDRAAAKADVVAKLENFNPLWSVKDRIGVAMIDAAEADGQINKDTVIIEPTSGNTGIGLAFTCAARGYRLVVTMPESMSLERRRLIKAFGAEIVLTPAAEGMPGAVRKAEELIKNTPNSFMPQQFKNPANPEIHRKTTAEEIWRDTDGKIDILVAGVGTGGTITGCGEVLKSRKPAFKVIAVEPVNSPGHHARRAGTSRSSRARTRSRASAPASSPTCSTSTSSTTSSRCATTRPSSMTRRLAREEGMLCGISCGAAAVGAIQVARQPGERGQADRRRPPRPGRTLPLDPAVPRVMERSTCRPAAGDPRGHRPRPWWTIAGASRRWSAAASWAASARACRPSTRSGTSPPARPGTTPIPRT